MDTVQIIPLTQIHTVPGFNHRRDIETERLQKSIEENGLIQPITVTPNEDGFTLIAGERRYTACLMSDLISEVPCLVKDLGDAEKPDADRAVLAAVENMQRADLSVTEKAAAVAKIKELGYTTRRQIAHKLSIPEREVKLLEQINSLSESTREAFHRGDLSVGYAPLASKIAEVSPEMEVQVTEQILSGRGSRGLDWLEIYWPSLLAPDRYDSEADQTVKFIVTQRRYEFPQLPPLSEKAAELWAEMEDLSDYTSSIEVGTDAEQAAKSYGCLIEIEGSEENDVGDYGVITDMTWFADYCEVTLIPSKIEQLKERKLRDAESRKRTPTIDAEAEARGVEVEVVKEERKAAREEEYEQRIDSDDFNVELGQQLFERANEVKPSPELIRLLIGLALRDNASDVFLRGMRYCHPATREEDELKNGKKKLAFPVDSEEARARMHTFFAEAKTVEELLGRFTQLWLASEYADDRVLARSARRPRRVYAGQFAIDKCQEEYIDPALPKLAKLLTPKLRKQAETRAEEIRKGD